MLKILHSYCFRLKRIEKAKKHWSIKLRVSFAGNRSEFTTGCVVSSPDAWDNEGNFVKKGFTSPKGETAEEMNRRLWNAVDSVEFCIKYFEYHDILPTHEQFKEKYWNHISGKVVSQEPSAKESQSPARINLPDTLQRGRKSEKLSPGAPNFIDELIGTKQKRKKNETLELKGDMWKIFDLFVLEMGKKNSWTVETYQKFKTLKNDLATFNPALKFTDLDESGITKFMEWLRVKKIRCSKGQVDKNGKVRFVKTGNTNTTLNKKLGYLKWFLKWATVRNYNSVLDFQIYKNKFKTTQRKIIFLNRDELSKLANLELPESKLYLDRTRDVFLFCCFSGLRYSDAVNLKRTDIKPEGTIEITTVKTADSIVIELNSVTKVIIDKYKNHVFPNNAALPGISNQKMNQYLKELCKLAGIDEPIRQTTYHGNKRTDKVVPKYTLICTHTGRRTFICNALSMGIPANIVMKWTGHSDYKSMKPYIDITDEAKATEMQKFNDLKIY